MKLLSTLGMVVLLIAPAVRPTHAQTTVADAVALFKAGRLDDARSALLPLAKTGDDSAAYYLGRISMRQERFDEASEWFERAVAANERSATYQVWLGKSYNARRERANIFRMPALALKQKKALERAVELDSMNVDARVEIGNYYLNAPGIGGGSTEKAKAQAAAIVRLNSFRGALFEASIAQHDHDVPSAERLLRGLVAAYPDSSVPPIQLAMMLYNAHRLDDALAVINARLARAPDDANAKRALARLR